MPPMIWASRASMLASETIVILLTLKVTYRSLADLKLRTKTITLSQVLLKNGIHCFFIPALLIICTMVINVQTQDGIVAEGTVADIRDATTSILISRFLLELLQVGAEWNERDVGGIPSALLTSYLTHPSSSSSSLLLNESLHTPSGGANRQDLKRVDNGPDICIV
ncbi:hypothetical protein C8Q74DRAFT_335481 [Fomes fomentarius]|nr:hypothetical protein C8Q74DRAFT_335481 [Fomes fomentarius]